MYHTRYTRVVLPLFFFTDALIVGLSLVIIYKCFKSVPLSYTVFLVAIISWMLASLIFKSYRVRRTLSILSNLSNSIYALLIFSLFYIGYILFFSPNIYHTRFHISFLSLVAVIIVLSNVIRFKYVFAYRSKGRNIIHSVLVAPENHTVFDYEKIIDDLKLMGYTINNYIQTPLAERSNKLKSTLSSQKIETVFILNPFLLGESIDETLAIADDYGIRVKLLTTFSSQLGKRLGLDMVGGYPVIDVRHEPLLYLHNRIVKRSIDLIMSILSIIFILSWLPFVVKIAQAMTYPGPLFFKQKRVGRNNKNFIMYKFRTMFHNPITTTLAKEGESRKTSVKDIRIPWFGQLLRRTNLDEYPQFINILLGTMSVVGPRPHMKGEDEQLANIIPKYRVRRFVKPGITGWAAINGFRGGTNDMELMKKRTEYDIYYLENWSLWFDIKIIIITIWQMITFRIPKAY